MSREESPLEKGSRPPPVRRRRGVRERRWGAALSVATHAAVVLMLLWVRPNVAPPPEQPAMTVSLVPLPPPPPAPAPKPEPKPAPPKAAVKVVKHPLPKPPPRRQLARIVHAPRPPRETLAAGAASDGDSAELTEAQLAGATGAGSGAGGGECDMARRLQNALRRDMLVRAAMAPHAGKAIMVWNGDWVQSHGEDGKGLAAVREAVTWEVAFAPKACRSEPVRGLIVISLNEGPGSTRLALGGGEWRWSDLLLLRGGR